MDLMDFGCWERWVSSFLLEDIYHWESRVEEGGGGMGGFFFMGSYYFRVFIFQDRNLYSIINFFSTAWHSMYNPGKIKSCLSGILFSVVKGGTWTRLGSRLEIRL